MRLILIILIAIIAFGVVQSYRHGCKFGEAGWYDCVMGRAAEAPAPASTEMPPPAAPAPAPAVSGFALLSRARPIARLSVEAGDPR